MPARGWFVRWRLRWRQRRRWRRDRAAARRITVVNQFFPPDYAATGQLLDALTARLAAGGLQVQILTGMPAYAGERQPALALEFEPNRCIRRSRASRPGSSWRRSGSAPTAGGAAGRASTSDRRRR